MIWRIIIFVGLGPAIGLIFGAFIFMPVLQYLEYSIRNSSHKIEWLDIGVFLSLPFIYLLGFVPALLTGLFDSLLARFNIGWRPLFSAMFGFVVTFLPGMPDLQSVLGGLWPEGLIGAVPAAICSWLSNRREREPREQ